MARESEITHKECSNPGRRRGPPAIRNLNAASNFEGEEAPETFAASVGSTSQRPAESLSRMRSAFMELRPFRSLRFASGVLARRGLSAVFAPPYDQISPALQESLYARAPENIVRVTYPKKDGNGNPYQDATATLTAFLADGTLEKERRPGLWIYRQTFAEDGTDLRPQRARRTGAAERSTPTASSIRTSSRSPSPRPTGSRSSPRPAPTSSSCSC